MVFNVEKYNPTDKKIIHAHLTWDRSVILWWAGCQALLCHRKHISLILLQVAGVTSGPWFDVKMLLSYQYDIGGAYS